MHTLSILLALASTLSVAMACLCTVVMARTLRRKHPDVWLQEGSPVEWLWLTRSSPSRHVFRFLDSRAYLSTKDKPFIRYCSAVRALWYVALVSTPISWVFFAYVALTT